MIKKTHFSLGVKATLLASTLLTAGCAEYYIRDAESMKPTGSEFNKNLHKEYKDFASNESRMQLDQVDGEYFAHKAIDAGMGQKVMPEDLKRRDISKDVMPEMSKGRDRLVTVLDIGGRDMEPVLAASTQANFDCWVEESDEGWQTQFISQCKNNFFKDLTELEARVPGTAYKVMFNLNSARLGKAGATVVAEAAAKAIKLGDVKVMVTGMADHVGGTKHNEVLSGHRTKAVSTALVHQGVAQSRIVEKSIGEVGAKHVDPTMRRVDISFGKAAAAPVVNEVVKKNHHHGKAIHHVKPMAEMEKKVVKAAVKSMVKAPAKEMKKGA